MKIDIKYEYKGHVCPFPAQVWTTSPSEGAPRRVLSVIYTHDGGKKFVTCDRFGAVEVHTHCVPAGKRVKSPSVIPWSTETAPFPLALRKKEWAAGEYMMFEIFNGRMISCCSNSEGDPVESLSFGDVYSEESGWEIREGGRCGEVAK